MFQLAQELENERQEKIRLQTFQNQLILAQEEKFQIRNEVIHSPITRITILILLSSFSLNIQNLIMTN